MPNLVKFHCFLFNFAGNFLMDHPGRKWRLVFQEIIEMEIVLNSNHG